MEPIRLKTQAHMAEAIMRMEQAGAGHYVPLLRAAMAGVLRVAFMAPQNTLPLRLLDAAKDRRPLVVILQDDGAAPPGPDGFTQARRLLRWAACIVIHATGGSARDYAMVAQGAVMAGRFLLVETGTARQAAWLNLRQATAPRTPSLVLAVRPGAPPHPSMAVPAGVTVQ